jgi:hypothetical protein
MRSDRRQQMMRPWTVNSGWSDAAVVVVSVLVTLLDSCSGDFDVSLLAVRAVIGVTGDGGVVEGAEFENRFRRG